MTLRVKHIEVHYTRKVALPAALVKALPQKLVLFTTIQYHDQLAAWKAALEACGKEAFLVRPKHSAFEGQLLGCGIEHWDTDAQAFLYVGDGVFHPKALSIHNEQPVYCYDPKRDAWQVLADEDIARAKRKHRAALSQFQMARTVGVLVTVKSGQQRALLARTLETQFPDKDFVYLLCDSLDYQGIEDFPFVEVWVNTMCPRIGYDDTNKLGKPVVNIGELGHEW